MLSNGPNWIDELNVEIDIYIAISVWAQIRDICYKMWYGDMKHVEIVTTRSNTGSRFAFRMHIIKRGNVEIRDVDLRVES